MSGSPGSQRSLTRRFPHPDSSLPDPTERLISKIHDFVGAHDAKLLVALQSTDPRMVSHLKSEGVPFVTLDGAAAFGSQYGSHFTPEGHRFAAGRLLDLLNATVRVAQTEGTRTENAGSAHGRRRSLNPVAAQSGGARGHDPDRARQRHALPADKRHKRVANRLLRRDPHVIRVPLERPARGADIQRAFDGGIEPTSDCDVERKLVRLHRNSRKSGSIEIRCTRSSDAKANGPGSSGSGRGSFGTC